MRERLAVVVKNDRSEIPRLAEIVTEFCERHGLSPAVKLDLNLALEEVIINVMAHGYEDQCVHEIAVTFQLEPGELTIRVEDDGLPFNPLEAPPADLTPPARQRRPGGLGIHFLRQLTDGVDYERRGDRNVLTFKKRTGEQ